MTNDDKWKNIQDVVNAAKDEAIIAAMFHETWRPTAYDEDLHQRIGLSFAAHSFQIIRLSLRREMLLALMRLWDTDRRAIKMATVYENLRNKQFFDFVINKRIEKISGLRSPLKEYMRECIRESLKEKKAKVLVLVQKYLEGGDGHAVLEKMQKLRNELLAHRQIMPTSIPIADTTDQEIESFYQDNLEIVRLLLDLILAITIDFNEVASTYSFYAKNFWKSAKGERT